MKLIYSLVMCTILLIGNEPDDLCYNELETENCYSMGACSGGMNCKKTYPLQNIGDTNLEDVEVLYDESGGVSGSASNNCGQTPNGTCESSNDTNFGGFSKATSYKFADDIAQDTNMDIWTKSMGGGCFTGDNLYGSYIKDGSLYEGKLKPCEINQNTNKPFDSWDTFRDTNDKAPSDRNISTKISKKSFKLSIGNLTFNDEYEYKKGVGGTVEVSIYDLDNNIISNTIEFNALDTKHIKESDKFTIDDAYKEVKVGFNFCSTLINNEYVMSNNCTEEIDCYKDSNTPKYRTCFATDNLSIRPNNLVLIGNKDNIISAMDTNYTLLAKSDVVIKKYNQTKDNITINYSLLDSNNNVSDELEGLFIVNDFEFKDGNTSNNVVFNFNNICKVNLEIIDSDWSSIDEDDTEANCNGYYICSEDNITYIPYRFNIVDINLTNMRLDSNYTYLSNDLTMSAHIGLTIEVLNYKDSITTNFKKDFYETNITTILDLPIKSNKNSIKDDINNTLLGFNNGIYRIEYNDNMLRFNYSRDNSSPSNPFYVNGEDIDINISTTYNEVNISNKYSLDDTNVTFYYGSIKSSKDFYTSFTNKYNTPLVIEIYCDKYPATKDSCLEMDITKKTNGYNWFLNMEHNSTKGDGYVNLETSNSENSVTSESNITFNSLDSNIIVEKNINDLPYIETILIEKDNRYLNWLYYKDNSTYKVKFVGTMGWVGHGQTGMVVETNSSKYRQQRLGW